MRPSRGMSAAGTLTRVQRLADGSVALVHIRDAGASELSAETAGHAGEEEIAGLVRRMLQLDLPVDAFHAFCASRAELAHIPPAGQGRMLVSATVWEDVCKVIATTNTTWVQTKGMVARLCEHFGSAWQEDPSRYAFPEPAQVAGTPFEEFAAKAKLGYRAGAVHGLAKAIVEGKIDLEALRDPAILPADLWKRLLALRGVGPYAAACLMIYLGRYDRVNVDSWARMMVGKELGRKVSDQEVHDFFKPYGEWQALVYHFYPWREDPPAY